MAVQAYDITKLTAELNTATVCSTEIRYITFGGRRCRKHIGLHTVKVIYHTRIVGHRQVTVRTDAQTDGQNCYISIARQCAHAR